MAKKEKLSADEKFTDVDFPLFPALEALDRKDYGWYDRLTVEQQKGFTPFMLLTWMSTIQGKADLQRYYVQSATYAANKHMFNDTIMDHKKLQWLMLCAISPGLGKQYHKYLPQIKRKVSLLQEPAKLSDIKDYFKKVYPKTDDETIVAVSEEYTRVQKRKFYLAQQFPELKHEDIELLNELVTDEDIKKYEEDRGN
jgi:hypothetical protein